jgi:hypothetical protein
MHTGNMAVIATSVMNPMWIGRSIIQDGLPCLNPAIVLARRNKNVIIKLDQWPFDANKHIPRSSSKRAQSITYGEPHFNVRVLFCDHVRTYGDPQVDVCRPADMLSFSCHVSMGRPHKSTYVDLRTCNPSHVIFLWGRSASRRISTCGPVILLMSFSMGMICASRVPSTCGAPGRLQHDANLPGAIVIRE